MEQSLSEHNVHLLLNSELILKKCVETPPPPTTTPAPIFCFTTNYLSLVLCSRGLPGKARFPGWMGWMFKQPGLYVRARDTEPGLIWFCTPLPLSQPTVSKQRLILRRNST